MYMLTAGPNVRVGGQIPYQDSAVSSGVNFIDCYDKGVSSL